ncbi:hypothetical protein QN277_021986 [Acacia crassicarpa]|uniref:Uncharacterized protein n=1 Tax=Acacia crassicarpa TaxID=499986 RepID=A0AAE1KFD0_9FABA|nr:hypothetical protein QN277_021986 [Acacia crassicarpa]
MGFDPAAFKAAGWIK